MDEPEELVGLACADELVVEGTALGASVVVPLMSARASISDVISR